MSDSAIIVSVYVKGTPAAKVRRRLLELQGLVRATGANPVGWLGQARDVVAHGLGQGRLQDLVSLVNAEKTSLVVFDQELNPSALGHVQRLLPDVRVVDRTQVILDIFAHRAFSREGRIQVELAQYRYLEPRIRQVSWASRSGGGIGTRGPGETLLELDRRRIRQRIQALSGELERIEEHRSGRRSRRRHHEIPLVALIGYTNVGKSTLYSLLTHRPQAARDAVFVTLDATVRKILVPQAGRALVVDTVGLVDDLPGHLLRAFQSTLDEVRDADVLVEVLRRDPQFPVSIDEQEATLRTMKSWLGVGDTPSIRVYNQWGEGLAEDTPFDADVALSAKSGQGLETLIRVLSDSLAPYFSTLTQYIPWHRDDLWSLVWKDFEVVEERVGAAGAEVQLRGTRQAHARLAALLGA